MDEDRIPEKILNMKIKGKCPKQRPRSRWEQQVRNDVMHKQERTWRKQWRRRRVGYIEKDREI
jgi:hypothetical protein